MRGAFKTFFKSYSVKYVCIVTVTPLFLKFYRCNTFKFNLGGLKCYVFLKHEDLSYWFIKSDPLFNMHFVYTKDKLHSIACFYHA